MHTSTLGNVIGQVVRKVAVAVLTIDVRVEVAAKTQMFDPATYRHTCDNTL